MASNDSLRRTLSRLSMSQSAPTMPEQPQGAFSTLTRAPRALLGAGRGKLALLWSGREEAVTAQEVTRDTPEDNEPHEGATSSASSSSEAATAFCYLAGQDQFNRQILVLSLAALPDPGIVPYDELLQKTLDKVAMVCEQDYVLVLMAAKRADGYVPGWRWIAKAYTKLERKYRKNMKKLYVVHPSFFIRVTLPLLLPLVSPKFLQKLVYIYTLSDLSEHVPLQQLRLGLDVLNENGKRASDGFEDYGGRPRGESEDAGKGSAAFQVSLQSLMLGDEKAGARVPQVLRDCAHYIRSTSAIDSQGIFRKSSNLVLVRQVASVYNHGIKVYLDDYHDPNLPGHLIKKYLRDLPSPLIHEELLDLVRVCPLGGDDCIRHLREVFLPALGWRERKVLSFILQLLHDVAKHSSANLMTASNLAIVTSPVLIRSADPITDALMCSIPGSSTLKALTSAGLSQGNNHGSGMTIAGILDVCIERYYEVFDDEADAAVEVPVREEWEFEGGRTLPKKDVKSQTTRRSSQSRPGIPHELFMPASPSTPGSPISRTKSRPMSGSKPKSLLSVDHPGERSGASGSTVELAGVQAGAVFAESKGRRDLSEVEE